MSPPVFDRAFRAGLADLFAWRRDVRRFRTTPVDPALIADLRAQSELAPSVGDSRPWRWIAPDAAQRIAIRNNFAQCNAEALADYEGERAKLYASLKLDGLDRSPVQFAVFCDRATTRGQGLGRKTMPQTLDYSVVGQIMMFWLAARAAGLGVGWVSIIDPDVVSAVLGQPQTFALIAYLCVGWPEEEHLDPELVRAGWVEGRGPALGASGVGDRNRT
ncbi:MAG: 5,6-dimethylbenzimidazole synthase [Hyphomicrobiales bacterium]|nr:5,6-dimethylbenzimidazole synthase [Hyphomicrobiales bacterium]